MRRVFKLSILILFMIMLVGCDTNNYQTIDSNKAMELINDGAVIIDVRETDEYDSGHIKDATNIPLSMIESIDYDKDKVIIVYCASGIRSAEAAKTLINNGYTNIYNLDGGLINWGFELEE